MSDDILHILECPMCLEIFDSKRHRPKLLPCQHTFCAPCLDMVIKNNNVKCPTCRVELPVPRNGVEGFPNNLTMFALIDLQGKTNEQSGILQASDSPLSAQQSEHLQTRQTISSLISQLKGKVHTLSQTNVQENKLDHNYQHAKGQIDSSLEKVVNEVRVRKNILVTQLEAQRQEGKRHLQIQKQQAQELLKSFQNEIQVVMAASDQPTKEDLDDIVAKCKNYLQHLHNLEVSGQGSWSWSYTEESKELLNQEISKFGQIYSNRRLSVAGSSLTPNLSQNETDGRIQSGQTMQTVSPQVQTEQLANRLQSSLSIDQSISPLSAGNPFSNPGVVGIPRRASSNSLNNIGGSQSFDSGIEARRRSDSISSLPGTQSSPSFNQSTPQGTRRMSQLNPPIPQSTPEGARQMQQLKHNLQQSTPEGARQMQQLKHNLQQSTSEGARQMQQLKHNLQQSTPEGARQMPQLKPNLQQSKPNPVNPFSRRTSAGAALNPVRGCVTPPPPNISGSPLLRQQSSGAVGLIAQSLPAQHAFVRNEAQNASQANSSTPSSGAISPSAAFSYKQRGNACKILGEGPSRGIKFSKPVALLSLPNTNLAVLDENYNSIAILSVEGQILKSYGTKGQKVGQFLTPKSFFLNKWNQFVISDYGNNRVQIWDTGRDFVHEFGGTGHAKHQLNGPVGVVCDRLENIYVCDSNNKCVKVFKSDGSFLRQIGQAGDGDGQFQKPSHIAFTPGNQLMVTDALKHSVQVFTPDGKFLYKFGGWGTEPGKLNSPTGIAVDPQGYVIVADTGNHRVQIFYASGTMETCFGTHGSGEEQFDEPIGIGFVRNGRFAVCDTGNRRIQII